MTKYLHKRHYTLEEARQALAEVRRRVLKVVALKAKLDDLNYNIYKHEYFGGLGPNGSRFHPAELEELVEIMKFFEREGIMIKSIQDGLIDFPCLRNNGDEIYLCWKLGEEDINFWHSIEEGFSGRKPVTEL
jgi:hypothetical protein